MRKSAPVSPLMRKLSGYIATAVRKPLPREMAERMRIHLLDTLSAMGSPLYEDIGVLAKALARHAPERLGWATSWPHPLVPGGVLPDDALLLDVLLDWAPADDVRQRILVSSPATLYGFPEDL